MRSLFYVFMMLEKRHDIFCVVQWARLFLRPLQDA